MKIIAFITSNLIALSAGFIGSVFTARSVQTWYSTLEKPFLNPPSWVFGPVWTMLYVSMGTAAYLVWQQRDVPTARIALLVYGFQLFLNALWSFLFFGMRSPEIAFYEIILLLVMIIVTTWLFWRVSHTAAYLLIPYILWVAFATYLNYSIWQLN